MTKITLWIGRLAVVIALWATAVLGQGFSIAPQLCFWFIFGLLLGVYRLVENAYENC